MAKPQITTKSSKQLALTYDELDQNFINLRDATIGFTVGSSTANIDLNSALTVTAGTNVTLALNTETKTLTINSQGGVQSVSGTAGRISSTGGVNPILDLVTTGVTAGSYTASNLTVDSFGRITSISSGVSAQNTFQTVNAGGTSLVADSTTDTLTLTAGTGVAITGNAATDTATFALAQLSPSPAGTYTLASFTVDNFGRVTSAQSQPQLSSGYTEISVGNPASFDTFDLRNGTNTTLLSSIRKHMLVKCGGNIYVNLPNFQNCNNQIQEFNLYFVQNRDTPTSGSKVIVFQRPSDQQTNVGYTFVGEGAVEGIGTTISGTTTIDGNGAVLSGTITQGINNFGWAFITDKIGSGSVDLRANICSVNIQPPPSGGSQATAIPVFTGSLLTGIQIVSTGLGYTTAPTFNIIQSLSTAQLKDDHDMIWFRITFLPATMAEFRNRWVIERVMDGRFRGGITNAYP